MKIGEWWRGLSSLGKLEQNKFQKLDNVDIHDEIGIVKPQLAMVSESTTPNEPCVSAIDNSGNVYFCSTTTGKIWKRTTAGAYSLVHTNTNTAHRGCRYFNGYLWYWTATKLGHYDLVSTWTDSFATGTDFREGIEANNQMLIANGRYIARVDASNTFSANELTLPAQYKATCLKNIRDDVLIGTYVSNDVAYCRVFLWDTVSPSWTLEDEVFEIGINCFMQIDNLILAQCGTQGRFYYWTGSQMSYFGKIDGITTALGEQKTVTFNNRPLFGNSNKIYSINREAPELPYAFSCENTLTSGTVYSMIVQGQTLLVSTGAGVEKRATTYATAIIETPEIQGKVSKIAVGYDIYPAGIGIETSVNGASYVAQTEVIDELNKEVLFNGGMAEGKTCQIKLTLTPSGANIPKVKYIEIL
jgi:hypothetical protein